MLIIATLMLQSSSADAAPATFSLDPPLLNVSARCDREQGEDILVCGTRDAQRQFRLPRLDTAQFEPDARAATTLIGDLRAAAEVEQAELAPGVKSHRIMLRLKLPF